MKTKYKIWSTSSSSNKIKARLETLKHRHPLISFESRTNKRPGKDKITYSIRSIVRKGQKR